MGIIKTALEIALDKTDKIKSDKSSIDQFEARQYGKKLANAYLTGDSDNTTTITEELKKVSVSELKSMKQGLFDTFITQISLPVRKEDEKRIEKLGKGLALIIKSGEFQQMFKQLGQIFSQYLEEAAQYEQMIHQQYKPKLRQKEEELSRRLGREVRIDPFQDPEFIALYNQHMNGLKSNYAPVIEQAKEETFKFFEENE